MHLIINLIRAFRGQKNITFNQGVPVAEIFDTRPVFYIALLRPVHNIRLGKRRVTCLRRVTTGSAYKMIWTCVAYAGIELISIPAYVHVATRVQINLYALPVATLAHAYIVNRPLPILPLRHTLSENVT